MNKIFNFKIYKDKINLKKKISSEFLNSNHSIVISLHTNDSIQECVKLIKEYNPRSKWMVLPHGTTICDNKMVLDSHLDKFDKIKKSKYHDLVDFFLHSSDRDLKDAITDGLEKKKGFVIGSPRYCKEWLDIKPKLGLDGKDVFKNNIYKVKILFLMPKKHINIFTEELIRTIDFISSYKEIELVLLNYNFDYPELPNHILNRINLSYYLISEKYSTSKLIDWADAVFHSGSGVIFESFMKDKITVFPTYLTSNTLISHNYNAGLNLKNRDQLRNFCNSAIKSIEILKEDYQLKCRSSNETFINDFVNANSTSVQNNIIKTILKITFKPSDLGEKNF